MTTIVSGLVFLFTSMSHVLNDHPTGALGLEWLMTLLVLVVLLLINLMNLTHAWMMHRTRPSRKDLWSVAIPFGLGLLCIVLLSEGMSIP